MTVIICPGIHDSELTQVFLEGLRRECACTNIRIFPAQDYPAYSAFHILQFVRQETSPIVFISFSAGVAGAIAAAWGWQMLGGKVKAFIALDGWGVPLSGNFPIHRLSHDYFTHWSSAMLGSGADSFYAEPPVEHLDMWRSPQTVEGWWVHSEVGTHPPSQRQSPTLTRLTATHFLTMLLELYGES